MLSFYSDSLPEPDFDGDLEGDPDLERDPPLERERLLDGLLDFEPERERDLEKNEKRSFMKTKRQMTRCLYHKKKRTFLVPISDF